MINKGNKIVHVIIVLVLIGFCIFMKQKSKEMHNKEVADDTKQIENEMIEYNGKSYNKSELSNETIKWLEAYNEIPKEDRLKLSYVPIELRENVSKDDLVDVFEEEAQDEYNKDE